MVTPAGENDSIITFGLELAEETEKSVGEIASELGQQGPQVANESEQVARAAPEQEASPRSAREIAEAAWEREQAQQQQELDHELEQGELER